MRQYTVNIRCMYDVTEGEVNYLFLYLFLFCRTVVAILGRLRHFVGLLFQIGVLFEIHCLLQHSIHVLYLYSVHFTLLKILNI